MGIQSRDVGGGAVCESRSLNCPGYNGDRTLAPTESHNSSTRTDEFRKRISLHNKDRLSVTGG